MSERVPDRSVYCTHSFRSGRASKAANSGVGDRIFQRHGRWKSVSPRTVMLKMTFFLGLR